MFWNTSTDQKISAGWISAMTWPTPLYCPLLSFSVVLRLYTPTEMCRAINLKLLLAVMNSTNQELYRILWSSVPSRCDFGKWWQSYIKPCLLVFFRHIKRGEWIMEGDWKDIPSAIFLNFMGGGLGRQKKWDLGQKLERFQKILSLPTPKTKHPAWQN